MNHRSTRYSNRNNCFGGARLSVVLVTGLLAGAAWAQAPQDLDRAAQQSQQILQQQQQRERQQREQEEARLRTPSGQDIAPTETKPRSAGTECSLVKSIALQGATLLSDAELKKLTTPYIDKCLTLTDINALIAAVTNAYVKHGYVTTRVYIPAQDLTSGQLQLLVVEGRLTSVVVNPANSASVATAFPGRVGTTLNLRDLEQGLDQINRLQSNSATIDIVPGEGPGASLVVIHNAVDHRWALNFSGDNSGTSSTGLNQLSGSIGYDNALHLNDYINFGVRRSGYENEYSASESLYASVPYGYWTFSTALSNFRYASLVHGQVETFATSGTSESRGFVAERMLYRNRQTKWTVTTGLTQKDVRNYIEGEQINSSSHKLSIANIETNVTRFWRGALLSAQLGMDYSINAFGAESEGDVPYDAPHARYKALKYGFSIQRTFPMQPVALRWQSELRGQYSRDTLFGTEQLSIGNLFNVRGYRETTVSGNRGAYLRNTLGVSWHSNGKYSARVEPYIGYDVGHIAGEDSISGWAVGWQFANRFGAVQVEYAHPLDNPYSPYLPNGKENGWLYASASLSF